MADVGMIAINDACLLKCTLYILLKKYFGGEACYSSLVEIFHETTAQTELGQMLDLITARHNPDLSGFTEANCDTIALCRTAHYTVYTPILLGLHLGGEATPSNIEQVPRIAMPLGHSYQDQDDYLDCFGSALQRSTPMQRSMLQKNYGVEDQASVKTVLCVYVELGLQEAYKEYE
ncbi:Farnesyl pyrophosphate synthetase [Aspergillus nanangensis]|uniref:Farnesyl pyrophosphate synthetase n=1 Tax=Aspergillus nanangensis TaxID=2582783 RepID=A0AAD4CQ81_ASPNN|nr:Farnesyl pyrophosphate synthetase [Aspergillus nanangensis]